MSTYVNHVLSSKNERCTSPFGNRTIVLNGRLLNGHSGMDFVPESDIITPEAGTVTKVKNSVSGIDTSGNNDYGNYVYIKVNDTYTIFFAHMKLNTIKVKVGDKVTAGQVIGHMGTTGYSTGVHLHFGIQKNGVWIDPAPYLTGTLQLTERATTVDTPASSKPVTTTIAEGDTVKVKPGSYYAHTEEPVKVPDWVCKKTYTVDKIGDDGAARLDSSGLNSWLRLEDLIKV